MVMQQRQLTPQDVNEVVRQLLPLVPQIVGALQGQPQVAASRDVWLGYGAANPEADPDLARAIRRNMAFGSPLPASRRTSSSSHFQQQPPFSSSRSVSSRLAVNAQAAFGAQGGSGAPWGQPSSSATLGQQDVTEEWRASLSGVIPQE